MVSGGNSNTFSEFSIQYAAKSANNPSTSVTEVMTAKGLLTKARREQINVRMNASSGL